MHPTPDTFVSRHLGPSEAEQAEMLKELGYASLDAFIDATVPENIRLRRPLALPGAKSEQEALADAPVGAHRDAVAEEVEAIAGAGRIAVAEIVSINGADPVEGQRRVDFQTLIASYPERRLTLETGRPAKGGPELTRRAIDLIAPIGYGQRALIVAPARAGKTMLMQAIT